MTKVSRHAPAEVARWVATYSFKFPLTSNLYEVSRESDQLIRAGHLLQHEAAGQILNWALGRLSILDDFDESDWMILFRATRTDENTVATDNMARMFLFDAIGRAVGGGSAYRKTEAEKDGLYKRIGKLVQELQTLIGESMDMDIHLAELGAIHSELEPLIEFSARLMRSPAPKLDTAERQKVSSNYIEPRLSLYLYALGLRLTGRLPKPAPRVSPELASLLEEIREEDLKKLGPLFGLSGLGLPPQPAAPRFMEQGEFGKYPSQKKALRKAVILELAAKLCPPVYERSDPQGPQPGARVYSSLLDIRRHGKLIKFSRADLIEKISRAWFGDAPDVKEINAMILPFRHGKKGPRA